MSEQIFSLSNSSNQDSQEDQFLRFSLLPDTNLMICLSEIAVVLKIPLGQIIPIPQMPAWVMGVYNWRGQIIWMIDLGQLLGFSPWYEQSFVGSNHNAVVIHPSNQDKKNRTTGDLVGLVVSAIDEIQVCNLNQIYSPPASSISEQLAPFLRGYWLKDDDDIVLTIDADAIFGKMPKDN